MSLWNALFFKDWENFKHNFGPAVLLGIPLILVMGFSNEVEDGINISWRAAYWLSFFFSSTAIYYRSFGLENRFRVFHVFTALRVKRLPIFVSQAFFQMILGSILGAAYLGLISIFWTPQDLSWPSMLLLSFGASLCMAPVGSLLGLALQWEREVLFSLFFIPYITPLILAVYHLSIERTASWAYLAGIFFVVGSFVSALIFEFFFDDLTQTY